MHFNLKQLEAFVWVADLGSFRRAADRLNTTQPNISSRISALENALETILMERDAGSVRLTTKGTELLEHARKVLSAADQMVGAANADALMDGVLRIGVTEMIVHTWLREFLRVLKERHPNITVELTVDLSANIERELFDKSIDLALQSGPFRQSSTASLPLGVYPLVWIASAETGLNTLDKVRLEDLATFPVLTHARGTEPYREIAEHFSAQRGLAVRLAPSSNLAACIHMATDGYGVAAVPRAMVIRELQAEELFEIAYGWRPKSLAFFARYDADKSNQIVIAAAAIAEQVAADYPQS